MASRPAIPRLADAVSPYLRSHAANPVDWFAWGPEAFAEAARRDVPVLVSIGYSTCHWCHVMARESFSDPEIAAGLNDRFVAIKVDREEHPEVDAAYLAAAGASTQHLGWPLNVFVTPAGRAFHAGTYSPPVPAQGQPSFGQVLDAVADAWVTRRDEVESSAGQLAAALAALGADTKPGSVTADDVAQVAAEIVATEDAVHHGFGGAPKFPVAPTLLTALALGRSPLVAAPVGRSAADVAERALAAMRDGGLRDPIEGGFFRYATRRDWSEPHYERMLTDNALLLRAYAEIGDLATASGIVDFLQHVLRRPNGAFGSAQDSESMVDGERTEGVYYGLDAAGRALQPPPAVDGKVLTGWNGLAIGALAHASALLGEPAWATLAGDAADALLAQHRGSDGRLLRATLDGVPSGAAATLEDYGAVADGLLELALVVGRHDLAVAARELVDACLVPDAERAFAAPGGGDPTLAAFGIVADVDPSEGAGPSGLTSMASAAWRLFLLTGERRYLDASRRAIAPFVQSAVQRPISFGALLGLAIAQLEPVRQVVVATADPESPVARAARNIPASITAIVSDDTAKAFALAGFELFEGRGTIDGRAAAYVCRDFVCALPVTDPAALD